VDPSLPPSFWPSVYRTTTAQPWPPVTPRSAGQFIERCSWHGLLPLLFRARGLPAPVEDAREAARGWLRILELRARLFEQAIGSVCAALGDEPAVLLKGSDYGLRLYGDRALRPMQDIDILVPADRIDAVCTCLREAGLVPRTAHGVQRDPAFHERALFHGKILVEVHQSFIQRPRHRIDYEAVWRRRVPLEPAQRQMSRLEDTDALAYHALSMSIDQFHCRYIRLVDLWLLLRQRSGVALAAAERAREWQSARAMYAALSVACRLFPEFRSDDVSAALARVVPPATRRFIDLWVLPTNLVLGRTQLPRRSLQLWRKACLMDSNRRRLAFAMSHGLATWRWRG
jgi:hypothetical protein